MRMIRTLILSLSTAMLAFPAAAYASRGERPMFDDPPGWVALFLLIAFFSLWLLPFLHHRPLPRIKTALCAAVVLFGCTFLFWAALYSAGPPLTGRLVFFLFALVVLIGIPLYWVQHVRRR